KHPAWGPRKLRRRLADLGVQGLPAPSAIHRLLRREGLIDAEASTQHQPYVRFERPRPNELWQMDFKGHFATTRGGRCHPLTILDDYARYLLALRACPRENDATVRPHLQQVFERYGLPENLLCDNAPPWSGAGGEWTAMAIWLVRLGIRVIHGRPYHPQTQGKEERFHRTLKAELLQYERFENHHHAQKRFDWWRNKYNCYRPHEAIKFQTPVTKYEVSTRSFTECIKPPQYNTTDTIRRVYECGCIRLKGAKIKVGKAFIGEDVAIKQTE